MPGHRAYPTHPLDRIVVIGTTGAGKSTFGGQVAEILGLPHIELDALFWGPGWTPVPRQQFEAAVRQAVAGERWLIDGNYGRIRNLVWSRATHVIWLDYSLPRLMLQLIGRTLRRSLRREPLFSGNRESIRRTLFSRESILLWALTSFGRHRREFTAIMKSNKYPNLEFVVLRNPRHSRSFLEVLQRGSDGGPDQE